MAHSNRPAGINNNVILDTVAGVYDILDTMIVDTNNTELAARMGRQIVTHHNHIGTS